MYILWCDDGLGNRLRPLLSLMSMNAVMKIIWPKNRVCDIDSKLVINFPTDGVNYLSKAVRVVTHYNAQEIAQKDNLPSNCSPLKELVTFCKDAAVRYNGVDIPNVHEKDVLITSPFFFRGTNYSILPKMFVKLIRREILQGALDVKHQYSLGNWVVGCHLRAADVMNSERINSIISKISQNTSKRFFVCSDMKEIEDALSCYPHVIRIEKIAYITKVKELSGWGKNCFRSEETIIPALIDLCCLSFCNTTDSSYHSYPHSTFLDVANRVSGWENFFHS